MSERPMDDWLPPLQEDEAPDKEPATPEEQVTALTGRLEESSQAMEEMRSALQRVQADFVNYKRRAEQEREEMLKFFNASLIAKLLPVLDDLGMALDRAPATEDDAWTEGVRLISRKFQAMLESEGLSAVEAEGKPFDPAEHEALGFQESPGHQEGHVVTVVRPGYKLSGRVLRPAQVIVARAPEEAQ